MMAECGYAASAPDIGGEFPANAEDFARTRASTVAGCAVDVAPRDAWQALAAIPSAALIDVRTAPEWSFVGVADLSSLSKQTALISWKTYPSFALNPDFTAQIAAQFPDPATPLFFICRSGGRSLDAALAMTRAGYRYCFNVAGGFEGEPNAARQRGVTEGWKASGLPWGQS